MGSLPIFERRDDLALGKRRRKPASERNDAQARSSSRPRSERPRSAPASARRIERRAFRHGVLHRLAPECVQAFARRSRRVLRRCREWRRFAASDEERRHLDRHRISFEGRPETVGVRAGGRPGPASGRPLLAAEAQIRRSYARSGGGRQVRAPRAGAAVHRANNRSRDSAAPSLCRFSKGASRFAPPRCTHGVTLHSHGRRPPRFAAPTLALQAMASLLRSSDA